jgi:hypothetical protein
MRDTTTARGRRLPAAALLLLLPGLAGCGARLNTVRGTVTLADGSPLTRGLVVFEGVIGGAAVSARGEVKPDGSYTLGTYKPGDGVPAGKYRVLINPLDLSEVPDEQKKLPFDYKHLRFETSGLEFEVKPGANEFPIRLDPPRKGR